MPQHPDSKPIAFDAYEQLAESFAAQVDSKPHNADYERPATLSLLPDVRGTRVLDAGCGPGVYAEWLVQHGAHVVAVDASVKMVRLARQRLGAAVEVRQLDLGAPLDDFADAMFDLVLAPLALDYIEDWAATFGESGACCGPAVISSFQSGIHSPISFRSRARIISQPSWCSTLGLASASRCRCQATAGRSAR